MVDGAPSPVTPEVAAEDLALIKICYQPVGSAQYATALEVRARLGSGEICSDLRTGDADLRWAAAVATFAEILKRSPYADRDALPVIEEILGEQSGRDAARAEMAELFAKAKPLLAARR